jgi:DNA-directed RNA polymerase beta' subunit
MSRNPTKTGAHRSISIKEAAKSRAAAKVVPPKAAPAPVAPPAKRPVSKAKAASKNAQLYVPLNQIRNALAEQIPRAAPPLEANPPVSRRQAPKSFEANRKHQEKITNAIHQRHNPRQNQQTLNQMPTGIVVEIKSSMRPGTDIAKTGLCKVVSGDIAKEKGCMLDPNMGPAGTTDTCAKCKAGFSDCPGHFGYMPLAIPIINPAYNERTDAVVKILSSFCHEKFRQSDFKRKKFIAERRTALGIVELSAKDREGLTVDEIKNIIEERSHFRDEELEKLADTADNGKYRIKIVNLFDPGEIIGRVGTVPEGMQRLDYISRKLRGKACRCHPSSKFAYKMHGYCVVMETGEAGHPNQSYFSPDKILAFFKAIDQDVDPKTGENMRWSEILGFGSNKLESLIMTVLPILPNVLRPQLVLSEGSQVMDDYLTKKYSDIVKLNSDLQERIRLSKSAPQEFFRVLFKENNSEPTVSASTGRGRSTTASTALDDYAKLNEAIWSLYFDKDSTYDEDKGFGSNRSVISFATLTGGKTGIFRNEILGKRSDYGGRTVIIGNPNLDVDEVGLSESFAERVTIPVEISNEDTAEQWNEDYPRRLADGTISPTSIIRIERPTNNGKFITIKADPDKAFKIQIGDTIRRKLINGDPIIISRQPVLHKGSIMAFRLRIMPQSQGNVMQINPSVTTPFNADFDGDEMNFSVPQDIPSQLEAMNTMYVGKCIRGDSSVPWIGLIQTAIIAAERLTQPDTIVESTLYASTVKAFCTVTSRRNPDNLFHVESDMKEFQHKLESDGILPWSGRGMFSFFLPKGFKYKRKAKREDRHGGIDIVNGILRSGTLTKADLGKSPNGMVDSILEGYGSEAVIVFLSAVQHGLKWWLQNEGFSFGMSSCILSRNVETGISPYDTMKELMKEAQSRIATLSAADPKSYQDKLSIENEIITILSGVRDRVIRIVRSGGIDITPIHKALSDDDTNVLLHEAIEVVIRSRKDLPNEQNYTNLLTNLRQKRNTIKIAKSSMEVFTQEINYLRLMYDILNQMPQNEYENLRSTYSFLTGKTLLDEYLGKIKEAVSLRSQLTGSNLFDNNFLHLVYSGAKGSEMNIVASMGMLGQQYINDKRLPREMTAGTRVIPHQKRNSKDPKDQGFCQSPYSLGLDPAEFYQHAMASRINTVETNLRPAETGYFYRLCYSLMEDVTVYSDGTVRDELGRVIQFVYGNDMFDAQNLIIIDGESQFINIQKAVDILRTKANSK